MKLAFLKQGERFVYAVHPEGGTYVKGGRIPNSVRYYVHGGSFVYTGGGYPNDEVIRVN